LGYTNFAGNHLVCKKKDVSLRIQKQFIMINHLIDRITMNVGVCNGKPAIRNMRFTVAQMLELVASGMTFDEILSDYPYIDRDDISACLLYASFITNNKGMLAIETA
jgi:uncharacterized protein (DUF433 family)